MKCTLCPRRCLADRQQAVGFCHAGREPQVSSISIHRGEEPPISGSRGICNVFFAHCNLQCLFCQNYEISRGELSATNAPAFVGVKAIADRVEELLPLTENMVGFVSPTHYAHCIPQIVEELHGRGLFPTVVYNTGGYDSAETLRQIAPYVDIYLPDFKYMDADLALRYSHAKDYPQAAQAALKEMFYQKGSSLPTDEEGLAYRGIIVRHLVLPGQVENSLDALEWIADNLSTNLHISLMAQYTPLPGVVLPDELNRTITAREYDRVVERFNELGFHKGWVQELSAADNYTPDFSKTQAFE